jgi:predicted enzyme related to lactoylglutathione lyase
MPHTIQLIDAAGMAATHSTTIWSARANEVGHFYRALGLSVARQTANNGQAFLAAQCTGLSLAIVPAAAASDPNATTLYFGVDSLASALAAATANHGQLVMQPYQTPLGWQAVVVDPDGRRIFITEVRAAVADLSGFEAPALVDVRPRGASTGGGGMKGIDSREAQALAAVKRGAGILLAAIVLQIIVACIMASILYTAFTDRGSPQGMSQATFQSSIEILGIIGQVLMWAQIGAKVLCGIPGSSRAGYVPLWIAVGMEVTAAGLAVVYQFSPSPVLLATVQALGFISLAAPFFFFYFLRSFMQQIRNEPTAKFAKTTMIVYSIVLAAAGACYGASMSRRAGLGDVIWVGCTIVGYVVSYIILLSKVLGARANVKSAS